MAAIDSNNCIPSGLRVDIMRSSMENKNLLTARGSTYVGTGEYRTEGGEKIYKTKALALGLNESFLQAQNNDLTFSKVLSPQNFNSSTLYENFQHTWNNFSSKNDLFIKSAIYTNLKLTDWNFLSDEKYPSLTFLDQEESSVHIGAWTFLYLDQDSSAKKIKLFANAKNLYLARVSLSISVGTYYFFFYSNENTTKIESISDFSDYCCPKIPSISGLEGVPESLNAKVFPQGGKPTSNNPAHVSIFQAILHCFFWVRSSSRIQIKTADNSEDDIYLTYADITFNTEYIEMF